MKNYYISILIFLCLFINQKLFSQNPNENISVDSLEIEENSSIMLNVSYTSNNMEYISGSTEKIPTLFANTSFTHKSGIYGGGSFTKYFSDSTQASEYELTAGYQKYFDNGFDIDLSYGWHNYTGDSLLEGLNYDHAIALMAGIEAGKFYFSGDISYMIGNTKNIFVDLSISRFIQFNHIFSKHDVLLINPGVSISFGTDYWIYDNMTLTEKESTFTNLKNAGYSYESFSYEGLNMFIPVSYGIKSFYLTGSWLYRIPGNKYEFLGWENQSGFMFSLTYFLNFKK